MLSPLAKGEAMQEVENIVRFIEMLKLLGGDELAALEIDVEKAASKLADLMNVPSSIRNPPTDPKNPNDVRTQLKAAAAAQGAAAQGADPAVADQAVRDMAGQ